MFYWWKYILVIPHLITYMFLTNISKRLIDMDVEEMGRRCEKKMSLSYSLVFERPYRNLFYYRVGRISKVLKLFLRPYKSFYISNSIKQFGGAAFVLNHPYGTILNCKSIGSNLTVCQLTTIGNAIHGRNDLVPTIGNNVSLGANVTIIGNITIGNNVIVGAGSVVVKDVPDNCIVAGNPAKIIRDIEAP